MTKEQRDSLIRQFLMIVGSGLGTYFTQKGLLSQEQISFFAANGPALLGIIMAAGGAFWAYLSRSKVNMVAAVAAMPEVARVQTMPTTAGDALAAAANAGPAAAVVPADAGSAPQMTSKP